MNKEVHYEGWLIKSPPTKRIWRARWRRRWFTLKQGEIPEQFCLEYYTDRNCRKLKGVIDLDQCEQVDCGLRLENRKQKFQYMFDIKTPRRTYYLAADTEADMRDWVNCICQVCHLHDTKQANDLQEESRTQTNVSSSLTTTISSSSNNTNNTTTTSLNSSGAVKSAVVLGQSINNSNEILRRPPVTAIEQQPQSVASVGLPKAATAATYQNNDCAYVNTEYTNRETIMCDIRLDRQPKVNVNTTAAAAAVSTQSHVTPASPGAAALYLNSPVFHMHDTAARLAVNSNGVVRKIPENLVLNNTPLSDSQQNSVQPSPALSTASGPYIPISECFSGSPKFLPDSNNSTTPLNNLDPKFYDTPRCHNNIGLNLTNDQSYSPKITNCGTVQQPTPAKNRSGRSDSDSESVFTDDEEWTHPMPLRENVDRSTRPSDSSVENESFVYTYSQRFSKLPDDGTKEQQSGDNSPDAADPDPLEKLAKVLKNKNNLILDIKDTEKAPRDFPQFSDTENTSPAIGPRDAKSVVEESYDIPRSHNLPYHNMGQLFEKVASPEVNPIAASTPNLMANAENNASESPSNVRTLPRPHCYTNAAPSKIDGNVFSYDFMEQADCPPVNRKLKPKISLEDKPPEEVPAKPPVNLTQLKQSSPHNLSEGLTKKLLVSNIQNTGGNRSPGATATNVCATDHIPLHPPSVDRKLKPSAYKLGQSATIGPSMRRSTGAPLSMVLSNEHEGGYIMETRTLPRHPRPPNYTVTSSGAFNAGALNLAMNTSVCGLQIQHQRAASAAAALQMAQSNFVTMHLPLRNEHKLQYFDLDVANPPAINRQSMSVGNLNAGGSALGRFGLSADPSARAPVKSSVVYNSVDFVKTEAFKRIREERKKENEGVHMSHK